jgi:ATP-binding cassette, subfamily C (CFTR/MRP), member 1
MLVAQPTSNLVGSYTVFISGLACCSRIQGFLLLDEKVDYREFAQKLGAQLSSSNDKYERPSELGVELSALPGLASETPSPVVDIRQATFTTDDQLTELLRNIDFRVPAASSSTIVGRVGCGKSSLLKGILGELHATRGKVHLATSSISYCDQTPWLRNISLRDNITGPYHFDKEWYDQVVTACALDRDFASFPCGDKTLVGSGGIALSGGQRQRVVSLRTILSFLV